MGEGTGLKEIAGFLKAEAGKGEKADVALLSDLAEQVEQVAARDYAQLKRLERKVEGLAVEREGASGEISERDERIAALEARLAAAAKDLEEREADLARQRTDGLAKERELSELLQGEQSAVSRLVLDSGLTAELVRGNVKASLVQAAKALLRERGELFVQQDGVERKATARVRRGGTETELSLADYVKEFLEGPEGRELVQASASAGAAVQGARPAGNDGRANAIAPDRFWAMGAKERAAFMQQGGILASGA